MPLSDIPHDTLATEEAPLLSPSTRKFGSMLILSTLLHLAAALYLASAPPGIDGPTGEVLDVSLSDPAPVVPPMTTPLEEADSPEDEVIPETTVPQTAVEPPPAVAVPPAATVIAPPTSIMFGISSGSFASFGDGLSLREDIRPYFLEILERINTAWQQEGKGVKLTAPAMLLISIERAGELNNVQILQSSGNQLHDRLLARAVAKAAPFPAVPAGFNRRTFETPIRFTPPLSLMSFDTPALTIPQH